MAKDSVGNMEVSELLDQMKSTKNSLLEENLQNLPTMQNIDEVKVGIAQACVEIAELKSENAKLKDEIDI